MGHYMKRPRPGPPITNAERARAMLWDCISSLEVTPALHEDSTIQAVVERLRFVHDHLLSEQSA
jgi:hypothetical protein